MSEAGAQPEIFPDVHTVFKIPLQCHPASILEAIALYLLHHHPDDTMLYASRS